MKTGLRRAVFAGSWYPARASDCEREIKAFIGNGGVTPPRNRRPVGGIVPHAGWFYSGAVACNVIRFLNPGEGPPPDVLVVFGMHLQPASSHIMMPRGSWETPFGPIAVAEGLAAELAKRFPFRLETPEKFTQDNTVELQLPFIKYFYPGAAVLAVGVAPTDTALAIGKAVVEVSKRLALSIRVIGSTDLTHYGTNYGFTSHGEGPSAVDWVRKENDRRVIEAMLELDPLRVIAEALEHQNACCPGAVASAIEAGRHLGAKEAEAVSYTTSYDRSPSESFVGYVGIVF
jgi:AmmeMemoRadiSam system protein B